MTIRDLRKRYGLTQQQLSDLTGIPKRTIENWEGGVSSPTDYIITLLECYLEHNTTKKSGL